MLDLRSLKVFLEVSECGSMTMAAKRLRMTQPAISQTIRGLETAFGVPLIDRASRPLALTSAGQLLRHRARHIIDETDQLLPSVRQQFDARMLDVRLGLVDSFAATGGPHLIQRLNDAATHVLIWCGLSPSLGTGLIDRSLDLIVTTDPMEDLDGLERRTLLSEPFLLLLPANLPKAMRTPTLEKLAAELPLVRYSARSHAGMQVERHLRRVRVAAPRRLEIDNSDALVAMVAAGLGWAITTPLCLLQGRAHAAGARVLPLPKPGFVRQLTLVSRAGLHDQVPSRTFRLAMEVLREECLPEIRKLVPWLGNEIGIG